jgi:hypothetical protein
MLATAGLLATDETPATEDIPGTSSGVQSTAGTLSTADIRGASGSSISGMLAAYGHQQHSASDNFTKNILRLFKATESISFTHFGPRDFRIFPTITLDKQKIRRPQMSSFLKNFGFRTRFFIGKNCRDLNFLINNFSTLFSFLVLYYRLPG